MPLGLAVVLTTTHLENAHLVAAAVGYDGRLHSRTCQHGRTHLDVVTIGNHQYVAKCDFGADIGFQLFYFEFVARGYAILLATGFNDRIHHGLQHCFGKRGIVIKSRTKVKFDCTNAIYPASEPDFTYSAKIAPFPILCPAVSFESLQTFLADDMREVDRVIRASLHSEVVLVRQVSEYIINSGGKRLRPVLVLLSAGAHGYRGQAHFELAAVVEFIHTATLLHDDVVDESELRRGRQTANALFGNAASVLVGDFLYSRAFQMMVAVNNMQVMRILSDATNIIAEGEVLQLLNCNDADIDEENYLRVIRYKTAKLFEAAARLGSVIGKGTPEQQEAMAQYGMHLGTAFQLIDDVLDYSGNFLETGKNIGDDLAEGKPTLPLLYAMKHGNAEQAAVIRQAIENGGLTEFQLVLKAIHETGALQYTREQAQREIDMAKTALSVLPDSKYKSALVQLSDFAVSRSF